MFSWKNVFLNHWRDQANKSAWHIGKMVWGCSSRNIFRPRLLFSSSMHLPKSITISNMKVLNFQDNFL